MEKDRLREFLVYSEESRAQFLSDLEGYESAKYFTGRIDDDGKKIDTTKQTIAETKSRLGLDA